MPEACASGSRTCGLRVFLGRDANGKVRHGYQTFRGGKRAAERELSRLVAAAEDKPVPPPSRAPGGTANHDQRCHPGMEGQRLGGPLPVDRPTLREHGMKHVHGSIGNERLATLSPYDVEKVLPSPEGRRLAEASVRQIGP